MSPGKMSWVSRTVSNWDTLLGISLSLGFELHLLPAAKWRHSEECHTPKNVTVVRIRHMWEFSAFSTCLYIQNGINLHFNRHCFLCCVRNRGIDSCFSQVLIWWRIKVS